MSQSVQEQLRTLLDRHPIGLPSAPEILEILKILFTEEEATAALGLTFVPLAVEEISRRAGMDTEQTRGHLESLAERALVFSRRKDGVMRYALGGWSATLVRKSISALTERFEGLCCGASRPDAKPPVRRSQYPGHKRRQPRTPVAYGDRGRVLIYLCSRGGVRRRYARPPEKISEPPAPALGCALPRRYFSLARVSPTMYASPFWGAQSSFSVAA